MTLKYWTGSHTKHRLIYHLVFLPKYRKRVLSGKVADSLKHLFYESCKVNNWWIEEINILSDHVHLLIQLQPNISVSKVVKYLKGGSNKLLRKQFPHLEEYLWGGSFWSNGYFAETVGKTTYQHIKAYIQENRSDMPQIRKTETTDFSP